MKTLVIISDLHCGSVYGVTPPNYWQEGKASRYAMQKEAWKAYMEMVKKWHAPDVLLVNGDAIEGRQHLQGGAELITPDRNVQVEIARECIEAWNAKQILMTYGSKYHVGDQAEDFEWIIKKILSRNRPVQIEGRLFFELEGMMIDARHKVGSSGIPHGRATPLLRDLAWNLIKSALDEEPMADIIIRSHVHYHLWVEQSNRVAFTTPALQLSRGRYGSRECTGETNWGAIRLTIHKGQIVGKDVHLWNLRANKPHVLKIA